MNVMPCSGPRACYHTILARRACIAQRNQSKDCFNGLASSPCLCVESLEVAPEWYILHDGTVATTKSCLVWPQHTG